MKTVHTAWMAMLLAALAQGCGLGTEIGNGFKEESKGESSKAEKMSDDDGGTQSGSEEIATPPLEDDTAVEGDDAGDGSYEPDFTFDINLLVAPCASPFGDDLVTSNFNLAERIDDTLTNKVTATFDGDDNSWHLAGPDGKLVRVATANSDEFSVTTTDGEGVTVAQDYQCMGTPQVTNGVSVSGLPGMYRRVQTTIANGDLASIVTWYTDGLGPYTVIRVTIDDVDGEADPLILDTN